MTKNTKAILDGGKVSNVTLEELGEAVSFLAKRSNINVDGQLYLDSGGDEALGAALSDSDLDWCRKRSLRLTIKEEKRRRNNNT
jgi:hypothetical protein